MASQVFMSFDGKPIVPAGRTIEQFSELNWDFSDFQFKANSYRCPIGEETGVAHLLMLRRDVQQISTAGYKTLVMGDDAFGSVTFPGMIFDSAYRLLPGSSQDPNALYLVKAVDKRFIAAQSFCNQRFNLRYPNSSQAADNANLDLKMGFASQTVNGGTTPYTWTQIIQQIATSLQGGAGSIVIPSSLSLTSTPENLRFDCISGWRAMCDVANRIGSECKYDPIADSFSMVEMGGDTTNPMGQQGGAGTSQGLTDGVTQRTQSDQLLEDAETIVGTYRYPEKVSVCFPVIDGDSNTFGLVNKNNGHFYNIDIAGSSITPSRYSSPNGSTPLTGTRQILYDAMLALWTDVTVTDPDNKTDLTTRATEVATEFYKSIRDCTPAKQVFNGARQFVPGATISEVIWREFGDGLKTEVIRYQPRTQWSIQRELPERGAILLLGKTSGAINKDSTGTVAIHAGLSPGSEAAVSGATTLKVYNRFADIGDGKWIIVAWLNSKWEVLVVEC